MVPVESTMHETSPITEEGEEGERKDIVVAEEVSKRLFGREGR